MKSWEKILVIAIIVLVVIFSTFYFYLYFQGKALLIEQLENLTHKKVSVDYCVLTPLFQLKIRNLNIEGLVHVDYIFITPSMPGFLSGAIAFNVVRIIKPEFIFERFKKESAGTQTPVSAVASQVKPQEQPVGQQPVRLIIKRFKIKNGKIKFIDHTVGPNGIIIVVKDLDFNLSNLYVFPRSVVTNFELKGKIPWQNDSEEGKIEAEGWINLFKKDMLANLRIMDIDGIALYPYYSNWVDLEKARIEKAKLNFVSNIHGLDNNVTAQCRLELTDIVRKPRSADESEEKAAKITSAVLDIFKSLNQGKIVLDFTLRTKMNRPEFSFGDIKMAFENKLAEAKKGEHFKVEDVLAVPGGLLQGTVKGATSLTKAVIDGLFSVGNELKKGVEDSFKKEKKD
jgi:hypothetical protein